jgi:hypothetical protein
VSRIPPSVVEEVQARAGRWCESCGLPISGEVALHHRRARSMGGTTGRNLDVAANLMQVHGDCHRRIHSQVAHARECGQIVPSWEDFESVPVRLWSAV